MATVYDALAQAQAQIAVPKGRENSFGGYQYRKAEDIISAFRKCNIAGASLLLTDRVQEIGGQIFVVATARLTVGGESIEAEGGAMHALTKKGMDASQITGSASSYARKYALQGLFAIDDGQDDPDTRDNRQEEGNTASSAAHSAAQKLMAAATVDDLKAAWLGLPDQLQAEEATKRAKAERYHQLTTKDQAA